jgi:hypothetical protein
MTIDEMRILSHAQDVQEAAAGVMLLNEHLDRTEQYLYEGMQAMLDNGADWALIGACVNRPGSVARRQWRRRSRQGTRVGRE